MSMDVLTSSNGRLSSLAKTASTQQGKAGDQSAAEQNAADSAKLFGSLLEKPQEKNADKADQQDDQDDAASDDMARHAPVYIDPQSLFRLAADLMQTANSVSEMPAGGDNKQTSDHLLAVAAKAQTIDAVNSEAAASDMAALLPDLDKKSGETASTDKKKIAAADAKTGAKPELVAAQTGKAAIPAPQAENTSAELAMVPDDGATAPQTADGGNAQERLATQPQQGAARVAAAAAAEAKADTNPSQAAARINDIQVISERSFGAVKTLQIRLDPGELGSVTARIRVVSDNIEVHLVADKAHAAEALAADRSMIEKALKFGGIGDDAKITVTVAERGTVTVHHASPSQNTGQQQAGAQQGQQGFDMQSGADSRNGSQGQSQTHFMGGEGRQNGQTAQSARNGFAGRGASDVAQEIAGAPDGRNRGLVV